MKMALNILALLAMLTAPAAAAAPPPFYALFQKFCVANGLKPEAVIAAIKAAGGKPNDPPGGTETYPTLMTVSLWTYDGGGFHVLINAGSDIRYATARRPELRTDDCTMTEYRRDDASADALKTWLAVPPQRVSPGALTLSFFNFRDDGHVRSAMPADTTPEGRAAYEAIVARGEAWELVLMQTDDSTVFQFEHQLASTPPTHRAPP